MGARGPLRSPNSRRGRAEIRKCQKLAAAGKAGAELARQIPSGLPECPGGLSKAVAERWTQLVLDMAAAGIPLRQLDGRSIAVAAGYEQDLADLDAIRSSGRLEPAERLSAIRLRNSTRKDLLAALAAIGGTPLVRLRARIVPEKEPEIEADPWASL